MPPHSPALSRAELCQQRFNMFWMSNHVRSCLGWSMWGDCYRGAAFQMFHTTVPNSKDRRLRKNTRFTVLTGTKLDASTVIGYPGQLAWRIVPGGKTSRLRDRAVPVTLIVPDPSIGAQWVRDIVTGAACLTRDVAVPDTSGQMHAVLLRAGGP